MDIRKWLHGGAASSARPPSALPATEEGASVHRAATSEEQEPAANVSLTEATLAVTEATLATIRLRLAGALAA